MQADNPSGWNAEDFIDQLAPNVIEREPWDPLSLIERSYYSTSHAPENSNAASELEKLSYLADTRAASSTPQPEVAYDQTVFSDYDAESPEDPVPTMEFDPNLGDDLYQETEFIDLTDIDVRLDLFLSSAILSEDQDIQIRNHLNKFSKARLSNWLPWLNSKEWAAHTLLLFIQFYNHWESNPEWWESRWHHRRCGWQPQRMPLSNILSRDEAYKIVHLRIGLDAEDMIDSGWFEEWDYHSLWRHGFPSFAAFASFRAALNDEEEWQSLISWTSIEEDMELDFWQYQDANLTTNPLGGKFPINKDAFPYSHIYSLPSWYDIQDWYPKSEWHDNLGF